MKLNYNHAVLFMCVRACVFVCMCGVPACIRACVCVCVICYLITRCYDSNIALTKFNHACNLIAAKSPCSNSPTEMM